MLILVAIAAAFFSTTLLAQAQQLGSIAGKVTDAADGSAIEGVAIEATSPVLPGMRSATTAINGDYRLPALPPGVYTVKFTLADETVLTRVTEVRLQQRANVDLAVDFAVGAGVLEEVIVVGTSTLAVDTGGASLSGAITHCR